MAPGDAGLGADALGHLPGVLEQGVEQRPGGRPGLGALVSPLDLAGDLALADDQAVQAGRDAEQVPDGVRRRACAYRWGRISSAGRPWNSARKSASVLAGLLAFTGVAEVQLDAVAGAEDDRLAAGAGREPVEGAGRPARP